MKVERKKARRRGALEEVSGLVGWPVRWPFLAECMPCCFPPLFSNSDTFIGVSFRLWFIVAFDAGNCQELTLGVQIAVKSAMRTKRHTELQKKANRCAGDKTVQRKAILKSNKKKSVEEEIAQYRTKEAVVMYFAASNECGHPFYCRVKNCKQTGTCTFLSG